MSQVNNIYQESAVEDLVDYPVVADAYAVTVSSFEFFTTVRPGIILQLFNGLKYWLGHGIGEFIQLLLRPFGQGHGILSHSFPCAFSGTR